MTTLMLKEESAITMVGERPPVPTAEEIAEYRRKAAAEHSRRQLANWRLDGFTPDDVAAMRSARVPQP